MLIRHLSTCHYIVFLDHPWETRLNTATELLRNVSLDFSLHSIRLVLPAMRVFLSCGEAIRIWSHFFQ